LWLFLYLFAWQDPELARRTGFGRRTFWLLLPGSLLGSLSNLPIFPWSGNILAVNIGGAAIPVALSVLFIVRGSAEPQRLLVTFLGALGVESGALLAVVLGLAPGRVTDLCYLIVLITAPLMLLALAGFYGPRVDRTVQRAGVLLSVSSAVLGLTFAFTATIPGVGIVSEFPAYLLAPVAAGVVCIVAIPRLLGLRSSDGLALGYATSTLGVLLGADLLRQPPLYATGGNVYSIGGAGLLDLVYLSGLLSLLAGYVTLRVQRRFWVTSPEPTVAAPANPTPIGRLRRALLAGLRGRGAECLTEAAAASADAAHQSRRLFGLGPPPSSEAPWEGLPVPSWVVVDQRNLLALARRGPTGPQDSYRGWVTARWLVRVGRDLDRSRLASLGQRVFAFAADLAVVTLPAVAVWILIVATYHGGVGSLAASAPFNAAAFGFSAVALLYFVLGELIFGTTVGKRWLQLSVRTRQMGRPGPVALLVRELPKLVPLSVIGVGGITLVALLLRGATSVSGGAPVGSGLLNAVLGLVFTVGLIVLGVGVAGAVGALAISSSSENQRLGDFLAGTWVIRAPLSSGAPGAPAATPSAAGAASSG
ncbi:MAG: RDD family protein, partial [Thermoplasmata archaeon]|nr:RDD family protein [Thermoplasmata archaeon]